MKILLNRYKVLKKKHKKGFTMIELVVVIAVLAILLTVLAPSILSVLDSANRIGDMADANAIQQAGGAAAIALGRQPTPGEVVAEMAGGTMHVGLTVDLFFEGMAPAGFRIVSGGRTTRSDGLTQGRIIEDDSRRVQVVVPAAGAGGGATSPDGP
ncbi:MAG: type II secretion system GspH family protein [Defluviitaleaceae bacterium]|nr:type II secretion system GspH family protein [Defluviitaleaceae bacterium]